MYAKTPNKGRFQTSGNGRHKRSSFIHKAKWLLRKNPELPGIVSTLKSIPEQTPWRKESEKVAQSKRN
jgi:hypothetical protein